MVGKSKSVVRMIGILSMIIYQSRTLPYMLSRGRHLLFFKWLEQQWGTTRTSDTATSSSTYEGTWTPVIDVSRFYLAFGLYHGGSAANENCVCRGRNGNDWITFATSGPNRAIEFILTGFYL